MSRFFLFTTVHGEDSPKRITGKFETFIYKSNNQLRIKIGYLGALHMKQNYS